MSDETAILFHSEMKLLRMNPAASAFSAFCGRVSERHKKYLFPMDRGFSAACCGEL
jgi:hypothetical protein